MDVLSVILDQRSAVATILSFAMLSISDVAVEILRVEVVLLIGGH